jgi:hypothetical protein
MRIANELREWRKAAAELVAEEYKKGPVKFWLFIGLGFLYGLFMFMAKR